MKNDSNSFNSNSDTPPPMLGRVASMYNGKGRPWDTNHRCLMEFQCNLLYEPWFEEDYADIITMASVILEYGDIGNKIYDMMIICTTGSGNFEGVLLTLLENFTKTIDVYDFVKVTRSILINSRFTETSAISSLMIITSMIMESYNIGEIIGVSSEYKKVAVVDDISILQLEVYTIVMLNILAGKKLQPGLRLSPKKLDRLKRYIGKKDKRGVTGEIRSAAFGDLTTLFDNSHSSSKYAYVSNLYNEISDSYLVENGLVQCMNWEREDFGLSSTSELIRQYKFLITSDFVDSDILKKRVLYVRDKGVVIRFKESADEIESISLREFHSLEPYEEHLLLVAYTVAGGITRLVPVDLTNTQKTLTFSQYEKDLSALLMIFNWLGVLDKIDISMGRLRSYDWKGNSVREEDLASLQESFIHLFTTYDNYMQEENISYEVPYQWNYDSPSSNRSREKSRGMYVDEIKRIGRYTRRLPRGQKASLEAQSLAKSVFIELEEGTTLVDEFERKQRVRKG